MPRIDSVPCVSGYRAGDEHNPSSPDYAEPDCRPGSEPAEFPWVVDFEPAHPVHGDYVEAVVGGTYAYVDVVEQMSGADRRAMRRGADQGDFDPESERESQSFTPAWVELPGSGRLTLAQFSAIEGCAPVGGKTQFDDAASEMAEAARDAVDYPAKNKMAIERSRASWPKAPAAASASKPKP